MSTFEIVWISFLGVLVIGWIWNLRRGKPDDGNFKDDGSWFDSSDGN